MKNSSKVIALVALAVSHNLPASATNWPGWRGPEGNGISADKDLPLKWSDKENVRWRVELPGPGNSSPIVWGDRVFVSQSVESENRRTLMCFDRATGKLLWQSGVTYGENEPTQENNPYCAGTPSTDGERVYVCFGSAGVFAYDFAGKEIWRRDLGKLNHMFGTAVSTVLYGPLCLVNFGPGEKVRLVALNKTSGEVAWEAEPPKVDPSEQQGMGGRFGGPGGPGGRGGRGGGFGPGMMLAPQVLAQADKTGKGQISPNELTALADTWFDKIDTQKAGKLTREEFTARFPTLLPPPPGFDGPGGGGGGGPRGMIGGALFGAAHRDKDGALTREEWKSAFAKWAKDWDTDKSGSLNEDKLRGGFNSVLPRPDFGGPGGPGGPGGRGGPGRRGGMGGGAGPNGSWSTPVLVKVSGRDELIVGFPNRVAAYEPASGKQLWVSKGLGDSIYSSPVFGEELLVAMSSGMGGGKAVALRPGADGDVAEKQPVWKLDRVKGGMGSGVIFGGCFYTISQDGIAMCLDLKDGKSLWEERLTGSTSRGGSWSSVLLAGGRLYVPNQAGDVIVLRAAPKFEVLSTNSVGEPTNASLAASDSEFFLRTGKALWCFASAKQ
jgi:outer membrane protein assembly factor BamB